MSGQKKQSFRFRLPWLPSLVAAPVPPTRPSSSQRRRKAAQPPLPPASPVGVIPIQRQILPQPTGEPSPQSIWPPSQASAEPPRTGSQRTLPNTESQPHPLPPGAELEQSVAETESNQQQPTATIRPQQPVAQAVMLPSRTNSQTPSGRIEPQEPTKSGPPSMGTVSSRVPLSGMDSNPPQLSSISFAPLQAPQKQATLSQGTEPQPLQTQISFQPPLPKTESPPPPIRETKPPSPSHGSFLTQTKSQLSLTSQKTSPTRPKSQPRSPPDHIGTPTRANSQPPSSTRAITAKRSSPPSISGSQTSRSPAKQPSPSRAVTHPRTTSLPPVPSRAVKSAKTSSEAPSHSTSTNGHLITTSQQQSPSPPFTDSASSPSRHPSSSYSIGDSSVENSKPQSYASHEYEQKPTLEEVEAIKPHAIKGTYSEATEANEYHTPDFVYDKMEPLEMKQVIATKFMEHPSSEEATDTEETDEDKGHLSAIHKGKLRLSTKPVSTSSQESGGNITMSLDSEKGEGQRTISLHKEIKHDVSDFIRKLSLGKLGQSGSDDPVSIITISGENKGATLHLGRASSSSDGKAVNSMAPKSDPEDDFTTTSDGEATSDGTKRKHPLTKPEHHNKACINSNIQSINNSMLLSSRVCERNPGVHFGTLGNNSLFANANNSRKDASSSETSQKTQVNVVTTAGKLAYKPPIIRRRCLRGLFMESSESEPDYPEKPRRHGCRYTCGNNGRVISDF